MTQMDDAEWTRLRKHRYKAETEELELKNLEKRVLLTKLVREIEDDSEGPIAPVPNQKMPPPPPSKGKKRARGVGWKWADDDDDAIENKSGKRAKGRPKAANPKGSTAKERAARVLHATKTPPTKSTAPIFWMDVLAKVHGVHWPALRKRFLTDGAHTRKQFLPRVVNLLREKYGMSSEVRFKLDGKWHVPKPDCAEVVDLFDCFVKEQERRIAARTAKDDSDGGESSVSNDSDSDDSPPPSPRVLRPGTVPRTGFTPWKTVKGERETSNPGNAANKDLKHEPTETDPAVSFPRRDLIYWRDAMADEFGEDVWAEWSERNLSHRNNPAVTLVREFLERKYGEAAAEKLMILGRWNVRRADVKELVKYINDANLDSWVVQHATAPTLPMVKKEPSPSMQEAGGSPQTTDSTLTLPTEDGRSDIATPHSVVSEKRPKPHIRLLPSSIVVTPLVASRAPVNGPRPMSFSASPFVAMPQQPSEDGVLS
ncbi:hypothetical protein M427DRAFT_34327 [Gonapodya prolifera JEL478]|uniref:Uncharacterized protein n=1 Tax=Gonapodya prolifera (strain JEL478) TaxID=1344416 RepID=A0A139A8G7_GONPJ|nr:hypothetical protein M427DRAFT_34327 [Gonapodya prolifera JEL478]|eukprot:KXS13101.1 hypothetical protein M427DRAFT_34327 [Gonapodya prolifera JEL478]